MIVELALATVVAAGAAWLMCPLVIAAGLWDAPDGERKQHRAPTPNSGGLAAATGCALAIATLAFWPQARWSDAVDADALLRTALAMAAAFAALLVGLLDDLRNLDAKVKFAVLAALAVAIAVFVARAEALPIGGAWVIGVGLLGGVLGSALWAFTLSNAVNFMDGANGLAMGSVAIGFFGLGLLGVLHGAPHVMAIAFCAAGGLFGLLLWNFPDGRIFAGDAGALFAGTAAAAGGLLLVQDGGVSPFIPPLLFFPLLADVLLTLAYRARRGRPMLQAHRDHLYQIGLRAGASHARMAVTYWIVTAHCVALAVVASFGPRLAPPSAFAPQPGDVAAAQVAFAQALAWIAALAPVIALAVLAAVAVHVSGRVRRYAVARGIE